MRWSKNIVWPCFAFAASLWTSNATAQIRGPFPPYGYPGRYASDSAARLQVTPRQTEVYVDGYYVGRADDFDGVWQRLRLPPGEHEIELFLDGHRTYKEKFLFRPGETIKVKHTMEPVGAGETAERPKPSEAARAAEPATAPRRGDPRMPPARRGEAAIFGAVSIRVQPTDAAILIDGEKWETPQSGIRLIVELPEGPHRVEIRKDGYRTYSTTIDIRRGDTVNLNVSLTQ